MDVKVFTARVDLDIAWIVTLKTLNKTLYQCTTEEWTFTIGLLQQAIDIKNPQEWKLTTGFLQQTSDIYHGKTIKYNKYLLYCLLPQKKKKNKTQTLYQCTTCLPQKDGWVICRYIFMPCRHTPSL